MMKARVLTLILASITVLGMLAGCVAPDTGEQGAGKDQELPTGDVYEQALSKLTVDMKGDDFVALGRNDSGCD